MIQKVIKYIVLCLATMVVFLPVTVVSMQQRRLPSAAGGAYVQPSKEEIHSRFADSDSEDELDVYGRERVPSFCEDCYEGLGKLGAGCCDLLFGCMNFCYTVAHHCCKCGKPIDAENPGWSWDIFWGFVWQKVG